jgi:hypothetical protein
MLATLFNQNGSIVAIALLSCAVEISPVAKGVITLLLLHEGDEGLEGQLMHRKLGIEEAEVAFSQEPSEVVISAYSLPNFLAS